jgi:hypothetical protein
MDDHYWVNVIINNKEFWIDPTYYQFTYNKELNLGGGVLMGTPKKFLTTGYKKKYICTPKNMTKFRPDLFRAYSGGKNNPKYNVLTAHKPKTFCNQCIYYKSIEGKPVSCIFGNIRPCKDKYDVEHYRRLTKNKKIAKKWT